MISADGEDGVQIDYAGTTGNVVEGDYIGTDATGTVAIGNARAGVYLWSGVSGNMVGGTSLAARNVISANGVDGVIIDLGSTANSVEGNDIGTDVTGSHALGNSYGVVIQRGSVANTVGGTTAGARNVISANKTSGVYITDYATEYNIVEVTTLAPILRARPISVIWAMALMSSAEPRLPRSVAPRPRMRT